MTRLIINKKGSKIINKGILFFMILLLPGFAISLALDLFLRPIFITEAEVKATQLASKAISQAIYEYAKDLKYTDMVHYQTNRQGDIILMQPNLQKVNEFITGVSLSIQERLEKMSEEKIKLPIAHALGLQLLASLGPSLNIGIIPLGLVKPPIIEDSFESAGINQTRHKIYMNIEAEIQLVIPFVRKTIPIKSRIPVSEVTIMGKVPDIYIGYDHGLWGQGLHMNNLSTE